MTRLVIMGPQGAGKGTQGSRLAAALGIPAISTGDIFRGHVARGSQLGIDAAAYTDRGELVPDSVTNAMVRERLQEEDAAVGFLLDGYPRTASQALELELMLARSGHLLDAVILLEVPLADLEDRLVLRAETEGRADDTREAIHRRLEVYAEETAPLSEFYSELDILVRVSGLGEIPEITERILAALSARSIPAPA